MNGEWTTELPTLDGFYWIRNYTINCYPDKPQWNDTEPVPTIVEISANSFSFIGCDSCYYANELLSAEWFGPIRPPDDKASSLTELFHRSLTSRGKQVLASQAIDDLGSLPLEGSGK